MAVSDAGAHEMVSALHGIASALWFIALTVFIMSLRK
jgi:hypothetical protein